MDRVIDINIRGVFDPARRLRRWKLPHEGGSRIVKHPAHSSVSLMTPGLVPCSSHDRLAPSR